MQMIDVLKRLAELDATNPNVVPAKKLVKESTEVAECGPEGLMGGMTSPSTPASLSVTAGSGEELGSMLAALMQLAGVHKVEPEHLGAAPQPSTMTAEPTMGADAERDSMRSVLDKMHDMGDEEETDESADEYGIPGVDTTPNDPTTPPAVDTNQYAYRPNSGSAHGRATKNNPHGDPSKHEEEKKADMTMEQQLMSQYRQFVTESDSHPMGSESIAHEVFNTNPDIKSEDDFFSAAWPFVVKAAGSSRYARGLFRDHDYLADMISDYRHLQKGANQGMMEEDESDAIDQFVNGNQPNFNGREEDDFDKAHQMFANFLKKKGLNVDEINDDAFPVLVAMCQGQPCAWYDLENAQGYVANQGMMEGGYNPNSASATHSREVNASHKAELEKKAQAGDESAKKRLQALKDKEERMKNDHSDAMER